MYFNTLCINHDATAELDKLDDFFVIARKLKQRKIHSLACFLHRAFRNLSHAGRRDEEIDILRICMVLKVVSSRSARIFDPISAITVNSALHSK